MRKATSHALVCCAAGAVLSALLWLLAELLTGGTFALSSAAAAVVPAALAAGVVGVTVGGRRTPVAPAPSSPAVAPRPASVVASNGARPRKQRPLPALSARLSANFRWLDVSPRLCRRLGHSAAELRGRPLLELLHPDDIGVLDEAMQRARESRRPTSGVCRLMPGALQPAGKECMASDTHELPALDPRNFLHFRMRVLARKGRKGEAPTFLCAFHDLTRVARAEHEALRAHKELRESRQQFRSVSQEFGRLKDSYRELYHNAPVMYFSLDVQGRLVTFNDTLIRTLGYRREELTHRPYTALLADETADVAGRVPFTEGEVETRWRRQDGELVDVWIRTVTVLDENGGFARYRSSALDLTERTRLADELRSRGDELESTNSRLRDINRELEDFTHVVSHDLKEPLRTLQTYSHLLAEEHSARLGTDGFQYINHLIQASRRLGHLIDDLLNLSQAGRTAREPQVFNLIEAIATVRQDLGDLIQRKEATVLTEGSLPAVMGDQHRITQLLTNLVANGLKYNQSPGPQVVIGAQPADEPHRVTVYVRDNGIGIDRKFHEQVFGIFRRLHRADEYEGTGAGLAICRKIVEAHGGRIWVESQPGDGATFLFTLPCPTATTAAGAARGAVERPAPKPVEPAVPLPTPTANGTSGLPHIVLVEDSIEIGTVIQKLGKRNGQLVTWFTTAEDAWEYLQATVPDLLVLDFRLPGMTGVDLCRRLRTLPAYHGVPVALFSNMAQEHFDKFRSAGANFVLSKELLVNHTAWQRRLQEILDLGPQPLPG